MTTFLQILSTALLFSFVHSYAVQPPPGVERDRVSNATTPICICASLAIGEFQVALRGGVRPIRTHCSRAANAVVKQGRIGRSRPGKAS